MLTFDKNLAMQPKFEKLIPRESESFRCFDRQFLKSPVKWHQHPEIELTYVEHGTGTRLVGDHIGTYQDGDLVLLGSELPHTWMSDEYRNQKYDLHPAVVIQFHPHFLGSEFFDTPDLRLVKELLFRASRGLWFPVGVSKVIGQRMKDMVRQRGASRLIELLSCLNDLSQVEEPVPLASEAYAAPTNKDAQTRIQSVCDYINNHLTDPDLNHTTLSGIASMNPSAFSRFFKHSTGYTVSGYINELRIGLACRRLACSDESILKISLKSGFANVSNFNRRFRQLRGLSPREYRNKYQQVT